MARSVIFGCDGTELSEAERHFFREVDPYGFILFARNIEEPEQVIRLVESLRESVGRHAAVLIDQEGGRVQRLRPPHWRSYKPGAYFGQLYQEHRSKAREALALSTFLMGAELAALGIDVSCVPLLDVGHENTHQVIGDRAFGSDPEMVGELGQLQLRALARSGVTGVIKHLPGHGRSLVDSHHALPTVEADLESLRQVDFPPFQRLAGEAVYGMTGHLLFEALDQKLPSTLSPAIVGGVIREEIGFDGLLMSDDLSMKALGGDYESRTRDSLAAGCDLVLHCNGDMGEMQAVATEAIALWGKSKERADLADAKRLANRQGGFLPSEIDLREFEKLFGAGPTV